LSGDEETDRDQLNPKLGITWMPFPATTLRAAVFRTQKRTLINDQTLEPTQVAGFNQFYDDANLTDAWRYGGAVDQKITANLYTGLELSKRALKVPFIDIANDGGLSNLEADWDETSAHAYLFWAPRPDLALKADYRFDRYDRDERFAAGVRNLDTQRLQLGVNLFQPSGLTVSLTPSYWRQAGSFEDFLDDSVVQSGEDDFWIVDAAVSYRLPNRYGFVSAGATNLFDQSFNYFEIDENNPAIQPVRTLFVRLTLALP